MANKFPTVTPNAARDKAVAAANAKTAAAVKASGLTTSDIVGPDPAGFAAAQTSAQNPAPTTPPLDWHQYLSDWGFPTDVVDELDRIFRTYSDANQASGAAIAYIRGTQWYAQTFPGIKEGIAKGIISDEAGYRAYTNQLNDLYQRYYGTTVSGQDVSNALTQGYSVTHVGQHLAGQAYVAANKNDIQFTLGAFDSQGMATDAQLAGYGDTQGGLDNALGTQLTQRYQAALQRLRGIFQGTLATPAGLQLNSAGRLSAPSLSGGIISGDVQA